MPVRTAGFGSPDVRRAAATDIQGCQLTRLVGKAREILISFPQGNYTPIVEKLAAASNAKIEFTMRHLRTTD